MKFIIANIKLFKLDDVCKAVSELGMQKVIATEVHAFRRQRDHT